MPCGAHATGRLQLTGVYFAAGAQQAAASAKGSTCTERTKGQHGVPFKRSTEEVTIRLMDRAKVCEAAVDSLTNIVSRHGWEHLSLDAPAKFAAPIY